MDLFEWKKLFAYLMIVDYYSRFIEIANMDRATAEVVIQRCKNICIFLRYDIPDEIVIVNRSQFDPNAFIRFSRVPVFHHVSSSP